MANRQPGRRWPARPALWAYGIRAWVPPKEIGARMLIVLFAAALALFGAAAASRLAWRPPPPMLSAADAEALAATVFPGRIVSGGPDAPAFASDVDGRTLPGFVIFQACPPA